jgi:hypothetical protein
VPRRDAADRPGAGAAGNARVAQQRPARCAARVRQGPEADDADVDGVLAGGNRAGSGDRGRPAGTGGQTRRRARPGIHPRTRAHVDLRSRTTRVHRGQGRRVSRRLAIRRLQAESSPAPRLPRTCR